MQKVILSLVGALLLVAVGCSSETAAPEPLAIDQIPAAFQTAFQNAKPQVRQMADGIVAQVKKQEFPGASIQLQALVSLPELTEDQRSVATRAMASVNEQLQNLVQQAEETTQAPTTPGEPATQPEPEAAAASAALQNYIRTK